MLLIIYTDHTLTDAVHYLQLYSRCVILQLGLKPLSPYHRSLHTHTQELVEFNSLYYFISFPYFSRLYML